MNDMADHRSTKSVGFVGLGAMGLGMASNLQKTGKYSVKGYDIYPPSIEKLVAAGGSAAHSSRDVAESAQFLVCMAANASQIDEILFGKENGALQGRRMPKIHVSRAPSTC